MLVQRIKTGFHCAGMVGAAFCCVPAIGVLAYVPYILITEGWAGGLQFGALSAIQIAVSWFAIAGIIYSVSRVLGWIIGSIAGDGQISN